MSSTLDDVVACIRPLTFENEGYEEYPYSVQSTGFLLRYRDAAFVVCAQHAMKDRTPSELFILSDAGQRAALPIREAVTPTALAQEHQDALDFLYFRVAEERMNPADLPRFTPWVAERDKSVCVPAPGDLLYFRGYPWLDQNIDYNSKHMNFRAMDSSAVCRGASILPNCHEMRLHEIYAKTLDGFSGSPVFKVTWDRLGKKCFQMVGMIVRGSVESSIAHITDIRWILGCMDLYLDR